MQIIEQSDVAARVILAVEELTICNQAMNEVANGIAIADCEFSTRLGCTRAEVRALLGEVPRPLEAMRPGEP